MKLLLTLVSANEKKSIMDILTQLAAESIEQKHAESESSSSRSGLLKKILIKGAAKTVEFIGEDAVNSVFSMLKSTLGRMINENLQQNKIPAAFLVEEIRKEDDRIKVTLELDSINYKGVINRFLPEIIFSARENDPENYIWKVYDVISDDQPNIVKALMDTISNDKKEEIVGMMIFHYRNDLCDIISSVLIAEGIEISIDDIDVISEPFAKRSPFESW